MLENNMAERMEASGSVQFQRRLNNVQHCFKGVRGHFFGLDGSLKKLDAATLSIVALLQIPTSIQM